MLARGIFQDLARRGGRLPHRRDGVEGRAASEGTAVVGNAFCIREDEPHSIERK
jgi:hypothetical protein